METADRKLYLGPRLRVLRRELGINQTRMAEELGISPSYLNHLERNQRPLTAQMLLRLAGTYDIDMRDFVSGGSAEATGSLAEALADPLVRDLGVARQELQEVAENYPGVGEAIGRFHRALADLRRAPELLERLGKGGSAGAGTPLEWLGDLLTQRHNHFPEIEAAAEPLAAELGADPAERDLALRARLGRQAVSVRIVPDTVLAGVWRHYDFHRRRLLISERLPASGRLFALAYQLALLEFGGLLADIAARAAPPEEARALLTVALANHAAATLLMPYDAIRAAADATRHDLPLLARRFGVSFEQLAHRLTTLDRTGARGIPFFLLKLDEAGNVAKRIAPEAVTLARIGGSCPRLRIADAFRAPGRIVAAAVEMPDGARHLLLARAARRDAPGALGMTALVLGCDLKHTPRIAAADVVDATRPIMVGPGCRLCERPDCPDRALAPVTRPPDPSPFTRPAAPLPFRRA